MTNVLLLTGTCGSGKSTLARLLAEEQGWARLSEDDVCERLFHRDRGPVGSHRGRGSAGLQGAFTRQSDVIYGRKVGLALTMDVFTPRASNGRGAEPRHR